VVEVIKPKRPGPRTSAVALSAPHT
jgi:hypothetical protein